MGHKEEEAPPITPPPVSPRPKRAKSPRLDPINLPDGDSAKSPSTTRAQSIVVQHKLPSLFPSPPTLKPKPKRSPVPQQQANVTESRDRVVPSVSSKSTSSESGTKGSQTPPPLAQRISSLPRNLPRSASQTDSGEDSSSAPNTPGLKRRPSRVAPPPPKRNISPPTPVRVAPPPPQPELTPQEPPPPVRVVPQPELTPQEPPPPVRVVPQSEPTPQDPPPPAEEEEKVPKKRLDAIKRMVADRKSIDQSIPLNEKSKEIRRKHYQKTNPKSIDSATVASVRAVHKLNSTLSEDHQASVPPVRSKTYVYRQPKNESPPLPSRSTPPLPSRSKEPLDDENAPLLPVRTQDMFVEVGTNQNITKSPESTSIVSPIISSIGKAAKSLFKRGSSSENSPSPSHTTSPTRRAPSDFLPPIPSDARGLSPEPTAGTPRNNFVVMKNRPLPAEPFVCDENQNADIDEHDYELFDVEHALKTAAFMNTRLLLDSNTISSVRRNKEQWPLSPPNFRQAPPPSKVDVTQSPNASSSLKKSRTFNGNDRVHPSRQTPLTVPPGVWPMYVDGYVNTEYPPPGYKDPDSPSPSVRGRQLPPTPFEKATPSFEKATPSSRKTSDSLEYDYPFMNTFTLPLRRGKLAKQNPIPILGQVNTHVPIPPRFPPSTDPSVSRGNNEDADDYIHMQDQFGTRDDTYINNDAIEIQAQFLPKTEEFPSAQITKDDMYMNVPGRTVSPPPDTPPFELSGRTRAATCVGTIPLDPEEDGFYVNVSREADYELDYINVVESLPASLLKHHRAPPIPSKQPVNTPVIFLPPRNIKRRIARDNK